MGPDGNTPVPCYRNRKTFRPLVDFYVSNDAPSFCSPHHLKPYVPLQCCVSHLLLSGRLLAPRMNVAWYPSGANLYFLSTMMPPIRFE